MEILSYLLIIIACILSLTGALGLFRLPDFYSRLHAVGITDTLCSFLLLAGLACQSGWSLTSAKLLIVFAFLLFTSPVSSYALAHSAWRWGLKGHATDNHDEADLK
ncbi:monovalent cation/H(+) antiporter subunit G [Salinimonas iocasae]|uniref:Monovalent cation/H(+) antiporter subunit G n=1 Tax=Salinimonas iocasae TaxID=2572577 RepID=A0A5B7YBR1_9ALTE|nr:monovalent cation/H(+) antiporter subunit G [Salinimonas iocasae]QCZ93112.1 monovalent cation/H(+) antiporter subunit G [Salinimonas iocasae]